MTYLLDVNVLVALFDGSHVNHEAAHAWLGSTGRESWATCPLTENGCVRVLSNPSYPSLRATPNDVMIRLAQFCAQNAHVFWADDVSLLTELNAETRALLLGYQQLTDFYLAALARHHGGRLATFDGTLARTLKKTMLDGTLELLR
ncbi:MAG: TA system VapC family ribonuclease toxin [Spirochaetia bacterium]|jgi:toxin-antitoxin system PIN domain toxin